MQYLPLKSTQQKSFEGMLVSMSLIIHNWVFRAIQNNIIFMYIQENTMIYKMITTITLSFKQKAQ